MEREEALQVIREMAADGDCRAVIVKYLREQGVSTATAYRWFAEATPPEAEVLDVPGLVLETLTDVLYAQRASGDDAAALKTAMELAKACKMLGRA